jgi:hypothetical protein
MFAFYNDYKIKNKASKSVYKAKHLLPPFNDDHDQLAKKPRRRSFKRALILASLLRASFRKPRSL